MPAIPDDLMPFNVSAEGSFDPDSGQIGVRFKLQSSENQLRAVMVGLWLRLPQESKVDFIKELQHYLLPGSTPSKTARVIGGLDVPGTVIVDMKQRIREEHDDTH